MRFLQLQCSLLIGALLLNQASAQTAVPVGAGSYASFPPASAGGVASGTATQSLYVVAGNTRPVPSNKWWTDLVVHQYAGFLWAYPLTVSADAQGINIYNPDWGVYDGGHAFMGVNYRPVSPISIRGETFAPADARASNWGDWTVAFRMQESVSKRMEVTIGQGLPFVWIEFTGVNPRIVSGASATYFKADGSAQTFPVTTNQLGITYAGRHFGIFAPDDTTFTLENDTLAVAFTNNAATYLIVGALPAKSNLTYFAQYAYAVPTNSTMNWSYNPAAGAVTTDWHLATRVLKGLETQTIQGWIPHHYRRTSNNLAFNGITYSTVRGPMKCTTGTDFQIVYPFNGILPTLPAPVTLSEPNPFSAMRMNSYIAGVAGNTGIAGETYAGGQDMLRFAQHMTYAHELARPEFATLANTARSALVDWYTYSASDGRYFAFYPSWKALTGFPASYGSDQFNDHHFHYGYFTHATALVGMYDQNFLNSYGPMARLVAKEYANWDRSDTNFPFLRTFDIWGGHSDASGFSSDVKGNNQESSSEAMQSWGGLFLLGSMLGDDAMRAAGAMGYAIEAEGVRQYWFNFSKFSNAADSNWPTSYSKIVVGILWDSGQEYQTYFGADPLFIHGIQWVPPSPMLSYLAEDPAFARQDFNNMLAERGSVSVSGMSAQWGNYALSYAAQFDPVYAVAQMDQLWAANDAIATDPKYAGVTYYQAHALRRLGVQQAQFHCDVPTSAVFYNSNTTQYSFIAYNPKSYPQNATVYSNNVPISVIPLAPFTLVNQSGWSTNTVSLTTNVVESSVDAGVSISWPTVPNTNYILQTATAPAIGAGWINLTPAILGDGTTSRVFEVLGTNGQRFYRVLQTP